MKFKTKQRLERKWLSLPLHHIDTSVILEPENTENGRYCSKYRNLLGYKYRGVISFPALGEILYKVMQAKVPRERYEAIDLVYIIVKESKIEFRSVKETEKIVIDIHELDPTISPLDRLILACAIAHKAKVFATLDSRLIGNKVIEDKFGIEIKHPKNLL